MARPASLSRERIVEAAVGVIESEGPDRLTARRIGEVLGVDPTSMYRHFINMAELERAVGDRFLDHVDVSADADDSWQAVVRRVCVGVRAAQVARPHLARYAQGAPPRLANEQRITEALLQQLDRAGLAIGAAANAYHALIELTVGSAAIDGALATRPVVEREDVYHAWRSDYAALDPQARPHCVAAAPHMYRGSADERFVFALDLLIEAIAARC